MSQFSDALFDMIFKILNATTDEPTGKHTRLVMILKARVDRILGIADFIMGKVSGEE